MSKDLTIEDLPGVGSATAEKLSSTGFDNPMAIAVATPGELSDAAGVTEAAARKMIQAARSMMDMGFQSGEDLLSKRERVIKAVDLDKQKLNIRFSYPRGDERFQKTLDFIKTLENRKFDSTSKNWSCPASLENVSLLRTFGFNLSKSVLDWEDKNQYVAVKIDHVEADDVINFIILLSYIFTIPKYNS
jgi:hypothetical protein